MYLCKLCQKQIKLIKQHLKFSHKDITMDQYFDKFQDKNVYDQYQKQLIGERRKNSPNCIEFYIHRGASEDEAKVLIEEHRSKLPFRNRKDFRPNQESYWIKMGYSKDEAIKSVSKFQSRSKDSYIKKYGKKEGSKRYQKFCDSFLNRKHSEIQKLCIKYDISESDAEFLFKQKRINFSPRRKEYWKIYHNMTDNQAKKAVTNWQSNISPRCLQYWENKGVNNPHASLSEWQDFTSIKSIMNRLNCNLQEATDIQNGWLDRYLTRQKAKISDIDFKQYSRIVRSLSNTNYRFRKNEIDPNNIRGKNFHLDHIVSIAQCYISDINVEIASSIYNLQILYYKDNLIKSSKSDISVEELMEKYFENQN